MTLVETLIAMLLSTAIAGALFAVLPLAQRAVLLQPEAADLQQRARVAVETLTRDLLAAETVIAASEDRLALELPDGTRDYYLAAGVLRRVDGGGADVPVVDDVARLAFEPAGTLRPSRVRVRLTLRARPPFAGAGGVADADVEFDVALRNDREAP